MKEYKQYLNETFAEDPAILNQAKRTFNQQKKAELDKQKKLVNASTGILTPARAAAREKLKLVKQMYTKLKDPTSDDDIMSVAGMESVEIKEPEINEDGEAGITTGNVGGVFSAKLGEIPNFNGEPYTANPNNMFTRYSDYGKKKKKKKRKKLKEDFEINTYIDNLFE